jgi:ribulose-5-phosphate 4-epimerase/fuculose-1-phosphate aldolase
MPDSTHSYLDLSGRPPDIDARQWALRVELAACYRVFARLGWTETIYNHITLRLPGEPVRFLINPFGLAYHEVTASNLVQIDIEGGIVGRSEWPVNPAGFTLHSAVHAALPRAHCVMHVHTTAGMAVACTRGGLRLTSLYAAQLYGRVAYHDFEGITVHEGEKARLARNLDGKPALILRNHGLLAWGASVPEAFFIMWTLHRACEIQVATGAAGGTAIELPASIGESTARDTFREDLLPGAGREVFASEVRRIDAIDPSYRS